MFNGVLKEKQNKTHTVCRYPVRASCPVKDGITFFLFLVYRPCSDEAASDEVEETVEEIQSFWDQLHFHSAQSDREQSKLLYAKLRVCWWLYGPGKKWHFPRVQISVCNVDISCRNFLFFLRLSSYSSKLFHHYFFLTSRSYIRRERPWLAVVQAPKAAHETSSFGVSVCFEKRSCWFKFGMKVLTLLIFNPFTEIQLIVLFLFFREAVFQV